MFAGLRPAVPTFAGRPDADSDTGPANPFTAPIVKSGGATTTVSETVAVCVRVPLVAVTVTGWVPPGAPVTVDRVS